MKNKKMLTTLCVGGLCLAGSSLLVGCDLNNSVEENLNPYIQAYGFKTEYLLNESLNIDDLYLKYYDDTDATDYDTYKIKSDMIAGFNTDKAGQYTCQVIYNGETVSVVYNVSAKTLSSSETLSLLNNGLDNIKNNAAVSYEGKFSNGDVYTSILRDNIKYIKTVEENTSNESVECLVGSSGGGDYYVEIDKLNTTNITVDKTLFSSSSIASSSYQTMRKWNEMNFVYSISSYTCDILTGFEADDINYATGVNYGDHYEIKFDDKTKDYSLTLTIKDGYFTSASYSWYDGSMTEEATFKYGTDALLVPDSFYSLFKNGNELSNYYIK